MVLNGSDAVSAGDLRMFRLSKLTDYAVRTLVELGRLDGVVTSSTLSAETGVPEPTVAKVLKTLAGDGLLASQRGARGGYRLAAPLEEISVARVIAAIDGPISLTACVSGGAGCEVGPDCALYGCWDPVNDAIHEALSGISLARMAKTSGRTKGARAKPNDACADMAATRGRVADFTGAVGG